MTSMSRTVRRLRLRADSDASVRSAVLKLEDALRCASLPDAGARVLLVRRLDLGLIAAGASPQTLSLLLEQRVAAAGTVWIHGCDPNAAGANFVFFRDALQARCELAVRLAQATPCTAWYWPLAVPEFKSSEGARPNIRSIALHIAALPEAPAALPAWIAHLTAAGVARLVAQAIGPAEAAVMLRAPRLFADTPRPRPTLIAMLPQMPVVSGTQEIDHAESPARRKIDPAFAALPMWAQTLAFAGGGVPRVVLDAPVVHAAKARRAAAPNQTGIEPTDQTPRDVETAPVLSEPDTSAKDTHKAPVPEQLRGDTVQASDLSDGIRAQAEPGSSPSGWPFLDAAPSAYGGLPFLLPVLQRLGYAAWAETLPDGAAVQVVQQLLALVLLRLHAPADDPAWMFASSPSNDDFGNIDVKAPGIWGDPALAAPRSSAAKDIVALVEQTQPTAMLAYVWLSACRRWLRRVAGIGVASLLMRPAALGLTATHADVFFRLSDADMRVRRAGLDFDPGWLPWYGRVVSFHYILKAQV